jgi:general secretion pathway protein N
MAGIEMNLRRTYQLLAAVAVLGAVAYIAIAHTAAPPDRPVNSAAAPPSDRAGNSADAAPQRTAARSPDAAAERPASAGNPLWALPLKQLSITRERPVFSPSRRPPPPATPTYVAPVAVRTPPKSVEPEKPSITLLGTILGSTESIGIFFNPTTRDIVRLRVGEDHEGWALRSVKTREATLVKDRERVVLELPPPGESAMSIGDFTPPDVRQQPPQPARRQQRH